MNKILIIEDDRALCTGIMAALKSSETELHGVSTLAEARKKMKEWQPALILLDINLPDGSGLAFLEEIRQSHNIPVIFLTANDLETDVVAGLSMGAEDYITKPFSLAILRARVEVQLRKQSEKSVFHEGGFVFDFVNQIFEQEGVRLNLSRTEQRILYLLVQYSGSTVSRERILAYVWDDGYTYVDENALSVAVNRLRSKLGEKSCIRTVYGIGYSWERTVG